MSYKAAARPASIGTKHNLPQDVRDVAVLRSEVIAWTALDPDHEGDIGRYFCCQIFGPMLFIPCFWPHLIILSPCLCSAYVSAKNAAKSQYWILTEMELKVVNMSHDSCCIPGCSQTGNLVKSIPLENITDCGVQARGTGCANNCAASLPSIYIDTASVSTAEHEATAVALAGHDWFIHEILNSRDIVKGRAPSSHATVATATPVMERGDRSAAERIKEITGLHQTGVLTKEEFDRKKQEIINSI